MPVTIYIPEMNTYPAIGDTVNVRMALTSITYQATFTSDNPDQYYQIQIRPANILGGTLLISYVKSGEPASFPMDTYNYAYSSDFYKLQAVNMRVQVSLATPDGSGGYTVGEVVEVHNPATYMVFAYRSKAHIPELGLYPSLGKTVTVPLGLSKIHYEVTFDSGIPDDDQYYHIYTRPSNVRGGKVATGYGIGKATASLEMPADEYFSISLSYGQFKMAVYVDKVVPNGSGGWTVVEAIEATSSLKPTTILDFPYPGSVSLKSVFDIKNKFGGSIASYGCLNDLKEAEYTKSTISLMEILRT